MEFQEGQEGHTFPATPPIPTYFLSNSLTTYASVSLLVVVAAILEFTQNQCDGSAVHGSFLSTVLPTINHLSLMKIGGSENWEPWEFLVLDDWL